MRLAGMTLSPEFVALLVSNVAFISLAWADLRAKVVAHRKDYDEFRTETKADLKRLSEKVPVIEERVEGVCERVDAAAKKAAEVGSRVHQHRGWFGVIGHRLGIVFREDP